MKLVSRGVVSMLGTMAVVAASLSGCTGARSADDAAARLVGQPAPEVVGEFLAGDGPKTLAESKGTVTIVDFWGTFCEPCKKSFPKLQDLVDTHAGKLAVIAVSQDDADVKPSEITKFAEELHVHFPIVWDRSKATAEAYKPPTMPTSFVIDKNGVVRHVHVGYHESEDALVAKQVEALVAE